jgi:hypothetical protein
MEGAAPSAPVADTTPTEPQLRTATTEPFDKLNAGCARNPESRVG